MNISESYDCNKFGRVAGVNPCLKDVDNTDFSEYIVKHRDELVRYASSLRGIDGCKADDLVHDTWISYKINEQNNKCYSPSKGRGAYITIEEAIKSRMKLMAKRVNKKTQEARYMQNTSKSKVVYSHFMESVDDDDKLQQALSYQVESTVDEIRTLQSDLKSDMMYFVACTKDCRIPGISLLEKLDIVVEMMEEGLSCVSEYLSDWNKNSEMKEIFRDIFTVYSKDKDMYLQTLKEVREEQKACKQLICSRKMDAENYQCNTPKTFATITQ